MLNDDHQFWVRKFFLDEARITIPFPKSVLLGGGPVSEDNVDPTISVDPALDATQESTLKSQFDIGQTLVLVSEPSMV